MGLYHAARGISAVSIAIGIMAILFPNSVADFFGLVIEPGQAVGWGEIGALYGGNFIGLGLVGVYATRRGLAEGPLLLAAIGVVWVSIAGGRLLVMLIRASQASSPFGWASFVVEVAVGLCFLAAARTAPLDSR